MYGKQKPTNFQLLFQNINKDTANHVHTAHKIQFRTGIMDNNKRIQMANFLKKGKKIVRDGLRFCFSSLNTAICIFIYIDRKAFQNYQRLESLNPRMCLYTIFILCNIWYYILIPSPNTKHSNSAVYLDSVEQTRFFFRRWLAYRMHEEDKHSGPSKAKMKHTT